MATQPPGSVALSDRTPQQIKAALAGQEPGTIEQFLLLQEYSKEKHVGLSKLSQRSGIPVGVLSQCFNGTYAGNISAVAKRVETFFWRLEQKDLYGGLREFQDTRLSKVISMGMEKTRITRRIQIMEGPEQVGKSRVAREYTARNNSGRTVYVSLSGGTRSGCGDFIWSLAQALNIPYTIKLREKRIRIKEGLESCDLVVVDELHISKSWPDKDQRDFWDYIRTDVFQDGSRGVFMIATNCDMLESINAFRRRAGYNIGQLLGRMRNDVMRIDAAGDVTIEDVELLVSRYYEPGKRALIKLHAAAIAPQLGHFGLLEDVMNEAWTRAKTKGNKKAKPTDDIVINTLEEIMAELKGRKELYE